MTMPTASADGKGSYATASFAGIAPANAEELAMAHKPFPAELPAIPAGGVAKVLLPIQHKAIDIAPGIKYNAWTFGDTVPGPAIHVREGQSVEIALRNDSPMPHADKQFVLVSGEYYLNSPGDAKPADRDLTKALNMTPDWVAFNGYAAQYKTHPLTRAMSFGSGSWTAAPR